MLITREDQVKIVTYPTEMKIVEHEDGTRITTFLKDIQASDPDEEKKGRPQLLTYDCTS